MTNATTTLTLTGGPIRHPCLRYTYLETRNAEAQSPLLQCHPCLRFVLSPMFPVHTHHEAPARHAARLRAHRRRGPVRVRDAARTFKRGFGATELLRGGPSVEPAEPALLSTRCPQRGRAYVG